MTEKYIYEKEVSSDKNLETRIRNQINKWANSIPHHPYSNLGDKIEIKNIWYRPAYPIQLRSQYEERSKDKKHKPFTGQTIPERKFHKLSDFNSWDIFLEKINNFVDTTDNYIVNGSQYVANCHQCNASGTISCVQCSGSGTVICPRCSGTGKNKCTTCGGSGYRSKQVARQRQVRVPAEYYYDSDGNRKISSYETTRTETYYETVQEQCYNCGGSGLITCRQCKGNKRITCPRCSGSGRNVCPTCNGQTELLHYFYVERKLEFTNKEICIIHDDVFENFPQFLDEFPNYESYNIISNKNTELEIDQLDEGHHLNPHINKFIEEAKNEDTQSHCMQFQQLDIRCIDTWEVYYQFNGKAYFMCFTGSELEIIPGLSPIYEVAFKYWKKGISAAKFYRYSRAARYLKKALKIDVYEINDNIRSSLTEITKKIDLSYKLGAILAGWLIAFFGGFMVYTYFSEVNYVFEYSSFINNPDNFLYSYHAWSLTILFLILAHFTIKWSKKLMQKLENHIPSLILRVGSSFIVTTILMTVMIAFLVLLNATGVSTALTFTIWLIIKILKIALIIIGFIIGIIIFIAEAVWGILKWIYGLFV
jgi:hypothetical protein